MTHAPTSKLPRRWTAKRILLWSGLGLLWLVLLLVGLWLMKADKPWRSGNQIGGDCAGSFGGTPLTADGARIMIRATDKGACWYGYALQREPGSVAHFTFSAATGDLGTGNVRVTLSAFDGMQRIDRVHRDVQGPANLAGLRLDLDVPARATLVEFMVSGQPGTSLNLQTVQLRETTPPAGGISGVALYEEAMDVIYAKALNADKLPADARTRWKPAADATMGEARLAIKQVLKALDDRHSFMIDPSRRAAMPQMQRNAFKTAQWSLLEPGIGYVEVPGFLGGDREMRNTYTQSLLEALQEGTRQGVRGWVVDLRDNTGGNMWPMLIGLEPLLREQALGAFEEGDGLQTEWQNNTTRAAAGVPNLAQVPVAVLTSGHTASSGEAVAIAFRGRANTRSFGQPTYGVSTANAGHKLQDGTVLQLTGARFIDRNERGDGGPVMPDVEVTELGVNRSQQQAVEWLRQTLE